MAGLRNFQLLAAAVLGALAAGCEQSLDAGVDARAGSPDVPGKARVVVAVIDSGINPYHEFFNAGGRSSSPIYPPGSPPSAVTPDVLAEFGIDHDHILDLTRTGDPAADYAADAAKWAAVRPREAYWFRGTNIIAVGRDTAGPLILPNSDDSGQVHGVAVAASALAANPEAIIYFIENDSGNSDDLGSKDSHDLAFLHPAVDIVSTSYSTPVLPEPLAFFDSFLGVVGLGKLHFSSGANDEPGVGMWRGGSGPWWSVGISGSHGGTHGNVVVGYNDFEGQTAETAGNLMFDFVADAFQELPFCATCQTGTRQPFGTSLSTPSAAGVASRVLLEARRAAGHGRGIVLGHGPAAMVEAGARIVTNWELRRALEQAAYVPTTAEWNPIGLGSGTTVPVNDAAPWLQVGWGELSSDPDKHVVEEALAFLGFGAPTRSKAAGFCDYQTKGIQARHEYWDNVSPGADQNLPDLTVYGGDGAGEVEQDPFIYCGSTLPAP